MLNAKKGISAKQLQRDLGIGGYKTAWYLLHRIRESMQEASPEPLGGIVEIDETYIGGKVKGKGALPLPNRSRLSWALSSQRRRSSLPARHRRYGSGIFREFIQANVSEDVERVMTDEHRGYPWRVRPASGGPPRNR